jgi:hypothetical protein
MVNLSACCRCYIYSALLLQLLLAAGLTGIHLGDAGPVGVLAQERYPATDQ